MKIKIPIEIALPAGPEFKVRSKREFMKFLEHRLAGALEHETTSEKIGEALIEFVEARRDEEIRLLRDRIAKLREGAKETPQPKHGKGAKKSGKPSATGKESAAPSSNITPEKAPDPKESAAGTEETSTPAEDGVGGGEGLGQTVNQQG